MTSYAPLRPRIQVPPTKIAQDTYVIHSVQGALGQPLFVWTGRSCPGPEKARSSQTSSAN